MRILFELNCKFLLMFDTAKFKMNGLGPKTMTVYFALWPSTLAKNYLPLSARPFDPRILNFHPFGRQI